MSAALDPGRIEAVLRVGLRGLGCAPGAWPGRIEVRARTGSTNDDACRWGQEGAPDGSAVFAEEQSLGRGRRDRRWSAPAGENLTFSVVVRTGLGLERWSRLAHAAALAVARGVDPWLEPLRAGVKWPNDVFVDGRKLAGILVEAYPQRNDPFLVVGIGLNVNSRPEDFAGPGLDQEVASVCSLRGGRKVDRNELAGALLAELWWQVRRCEADFEGVRRELRSRSWLLGKRVGVWMGEGKLEGEAVDLGENGELCVRGADGEVREVVSADQVRAVSLE